MGWRSIRRRMRENLDAALGLPLAESLMMALAPKIGRARSAPPGRGRVQSWRWRAAGRSLRSPRPSLPSPANFPPEEIDRALDPGALSRQRRSDDRRGARRGPPRHGGGLMAEFTTSDGVRIHYEMEGREDGPPLVFSNSLGTNLHHLGCAGRGGGRPRLSRHPLRPARPRPIGGAGRRLQLERLGNDVIDLLDALKIDKDRVLRPLDGRHDRRLARACTSRAASPAWRSATPPPHAAARASGTTASRRSGAAAWKRSSTASSSAGSRPNSGRRNTARQRARPRR